MLSLQFEEDVSTIAFFVVYITLIINHTAWGAIRFGVIVFTLIMSNLWN